MCILQTNLSVWIRMDRICKPLEAFKVLSIDSLKSFIETEKWHTKYWGSIYERNKINQQVHPTLSEEENAEDHTSRKPKIKSGTTVSWKKQNVYIISMLHSCQVGKDL